MSHKARCGCAICEFAKLVDCLEMTLHHTRRHTPMGPTNDEVMNAKASATPPAAAVDIPTLQARLRLLNDEAQAIGKIWYRPLLPSEQARLDAIFKEFNDTETLLEEAVVAAAKRLPCYFDPATGGLRYDLQQWRRILKETAQDQSARPVIIRSVTDDDAPALEFSVDQDGNVRIAWMHGATVVLSAHEAHELTEFLDLARAAVDAAIRARQS